MKRGAVSLLLGTLLFLSLPGAASAASAQFTDIQNHWAKDNILTFASKGFIEGYPDGTFQPDKSISRAEFTCILLNSMGITPSSGSATATFSDTSTHWAHDQIAEAAQKGILIVSEYPTGLKPDDPILRSEAAAMMVRALGKQPDLTATDFQDQSQIAKSMYRGYIKTAYDEGLMHGYTDGTFLPYSGVKRAEACAMLSNLLNKTGASGVSSGGTGGTVGASNLTGLMVDGNRYSLTSDKIYLRQDLVNIPVYSIGQASGQIYINSIFPFALNSAGSNPDLVVNNTRYTDCQLGVNGSDLLVTPATVRLDSLSNGDYKYNADYVKLYIGNKNSDYYLSDAELTDQHTVKIDGNSYDITDTQIAIALGDDFYAIEGISFGNSTSLDLVDIDPVVINGLGLSNVLAVFIDSQSRELNSIDNISFIIDGKYYDMSDITIDASGEFTVDNNSFTPDQATIIVDSSFYQLSEVKSLNGKFIFYCTDTGATTWVKIDNKYLDASGVQILKGNDVYSVDDILVVSRNVVRIAGRQYSADDILCRFDGAIYDIDDINYDSSLDMIKMKVSESTTSWTGSQPEKYVFYLNNAVYQDGIASADTIYVDGDWLTFDSITFSDQSHFTYNSSTYNLVGRKARISGIQFVITDTAWRISSQILDVYLEKV